MRNGRQSGEWGSACQPRDSGGISGKNIILKTIALVTCVAEKRNSAAPAKDLYTGPLFERFMHQARLAEADEIYILSGLHHLLELTEIIEPYDVNLNLVADTDLQAWAATVIDQLNKRADLNNDRFVLIANPTYLKYLIPQIANYTIPIEIE